MLDRRAVQRQHDVTRLQPGLDRRPAGDDVGNQRAGRLGHAQRLGDLRRHLLEGRSDIGPLEEVVAVLRRLDDRAHHVGGDREADADRAAAAAVDRAVDADQLAAHVDQRAAGIAGIDRRVGLDEEAEVGNAFIRARQRRDDAAGRRLPDAERIADGEHQVADLERVGIADRDHRKRLRQFDLEHGEVEQLVLQEQLALEFAAVGGRDLHRVGILDHVEIGDDHARSIDQHAGAQRLLHPRRHLLIAEEPLEERIAREWRARLHILRGVDVDDGRRGILDQRREGQLHLGPAERHPLAVGRGRRRGCGRPAAQPPRAGPPPSNSLNRSPSVLVSSAAARPSGSSRASDSRAGANSFGAFRRIANPPDRLARIVATIGEIERLDRVELRCLLPVWRGWRRGRRPPEPRSLQQAGSRACRSAPIAPPTACFRADAQTASDDLQQVGPARQRIAVAMAKNTFCI